MSGALGKSGRRTSGDSDSVTSSRASGDGRSRSGWGDVEQNRLYGLAPVRVDPGVSPAVVAGLPTAETSGPSGSRSSTSADLQRSLASRLRKGLAGRGFPGYKLTWSEWAMGSREPICALRASVRRTSGPGFTGWPTPNARDAKVGSRRSYEERGGGRKGESLSNLAQSLDPGPGSRSSKSGGRFVSLNPELTRWLMQFPAAWSCCAATATRLSRSLARRSSGRRSRR